MFLGRAQLAFLLLLVCASGYVLAETRSPSASPHERGLKACGNCHTSSGWKPLRSLPEFNHDTTKYPLRGMHADVTCRNCHTSLVFSKAGTQCASCHADLHRRQFGASCERCHNVKGWRVSLRDVQQHQNRFPLLGAHATVDCDSCHKNAAVGQYQGLQTNCAGCHLATYLTVKTPNHVATNFGTQCQTCHSQNSWQGARFDHAAFTGIPLTGAHATLPCSACHSNGNYQGTSTICFTCHAADYAGATDPNHSQANFPTQCGQCHTTVTWAGATFNHNATPFPLTGAHVTVTCALCHVKGRYAGTPTTCIACHNADYSGAKNPDHVAAGFPQDCTICHTTAQWMGAKFDHTAYTKFPLTGAHATLACTTCHLNGQYQGTSAVCYSCHQKDYAGTTNPNHAQAGFSTLCAQCHSTASWAGATFNHNSTPFPLTGAHVSLACAQCHVGGQYANTPTTCFACHSADFNGAKSPNHVAAGFPQDCTLCHTTVQWMGAKFNHSAFPFALTGAHLTVPCASCHTAGVPYASTQQQCSACHMTDYNKTTNPNHAAAGFPTTCAMCHTTAPGWVGATINHSAFPFALTGAHLTVPCASCHKPGVAYASTPQQCSACHMTEYNGTTNPKHSAAGFPTDCSICHSTANWTGATFNHNATPFPLTGAHTTLACSSCHASGVYVGLSTGCSSCHMALYNGTTNPKHSTAGFPTDCSVCHSTTSWTTATFNHSTWFPLTGLHATTPCASCHINGVYAATPTDCYSCHKADYTGANAPNHVAAGFPTTCSTCHTTTGWTGASFNHTWFPIYSGSHVGKWTACSDCHSNATNYALFVCTTCHTSAQVTPHHSGVKNYVYNSTNCYACHPQGRAG